MSLEDEIALYQFAQGVHLDIGPLDRFSQLDAEKKRRRFVHVYCRVCEGKFVDAEIEQALSECSLNATDSVYSYLNLRRLAGGSTRVLCIPNTANPPGGTLDKPYKVLLCLFKIAYQRRLELEKTNPANWQYRDLSSDEIVQAIRSGYWALLEDMYTNPSFRSEFVCLAKLWYEQDKSFRAKHHEPEPVSERQTKFDFHTYDELVTASNKMFDLKTNHDMAILGRSVTKGLSVRYGLDLEQARKLMFDVIDRHVHETYKADLFD